MKTRSSETSVSGVPASRPMYSSAWRVVAGFSALFRLVHALRNWQMFEVFMLGILVSVVKLAHLSNVIPGFGLWAFFGLMFTSIAAAASYDEEDIWDHVESIRSGRKIDAAAGAVG